MCLQIISNTNNSRKNIVAAHQCTLSIIQLLKLRNKERFWKDCTTGNGLSSLNSSGITSKPTPFRRAGV